MTTYTVVQSRKVRTARMYLDMVTACQFLNQLVKLERDFKEEEEFYRNIRHFFHHAIITVNQFYRWETVLHAITLWKRDARFNFNQEERKRFKDLLQLAQKMLQCKDEATDIATLIIYNIEEKEYQLWFNQW